MELAMCGESLTEPEILSQGEILSFIGRQQGKNGLRLQANEVDQHGDEVNQQQPQPHVL
jgi:hypothetical protein